MGWFGHGLYDGDGTQTEHLTFLEWVGIKDKTGDVQEECLMFRRTKLTPEYRDKVVKNLDKIVKKLPKRKLFSGTVESDDDAIRWQMFGSLLIDNQIKIPKKEKERIIQATEYLMGQHAADFNNPGLRRRNLRRFIEKVKKSR